MRRIKAARITHISLVPRGANRMPVIYKADDQTVDLEMLFKASEDQGELTAIVYAPETRDSQGDVASADVVKQMMYDAAKEGVEIDLRHDGVAVNKENAYIAESFLVQKGDPRFEGIKDYHDNPVDPAGSWGVVIKIDDPVLRQKYRDGEWNGVSMGGTAVVESDKSDDGVERLLAGMSKLLNDTDHQGDIDMTPEELTAALEKSNETLATSILAGVKELVKSDDTKKEEAPKKEEPAAPVFKGDPFDEEAVAAHQRKVALFAITKDVDWTDPVSIGEYQAKMAEFKEEFGDVEPEKKTVRRTNRVVKDQAEEADMVFEGVSKEDQDCAKIGLEMAQWANKSRGFDS
jgi:hypothetical protein